MFGLGLHLIHVETLFHLVETHCREFVKSAFEGGIRLRVVLNDCLQIGEELTGALRGKRVNNRRALFLELRPELVSHLAIKGLLSAKHVCEVGIDIDIGRGN